jgi:hypothetical protein
MSYGRENRNMSSKKTQKVSEHAHRGSKKNGRRRSGGVVTEERLASERSALLAERQSELEGVLDTHDTLVSGMAADDDLNRV